MEIIAYSALLHSLSMDGEVSLYKFKHRQLRLKLLKPIKTRLQTVYAHGLRLGPFMPGLDLDPLSNFPILPNFSGE